MLDDLPLDLRPIGAPVALGDEVDVLALMQGVFPEEFHGGTSNRIISVPTHPCKSHN